MNDPFILPVKPLLMNQSTPSLPCQSILSKSWRRFSRAGTLAAVLVSAITPMAKALVLTTGTLSIAPNGTLDLKNNNLIVKTGSVGVATGGVYNGIQRYAQTGLYNGPGGNPWTGPGINSSTAAADPNVAHAVGVVDNAIAGYAAWPPLDPHPLTGPEILAKYTYFGDADLDGRITSGDYLLIGDPSLGPVSWLSGDFDYDGAITSGDYLLIGGGQAAFDGAGGGPLVSQGAVPEPAGMALVSVGVLSLLARRRKN